MKQLQILAGSLFVLFALNVNAQTPVEVKLIAAIEDGKQELPERQPDDEYVEAQTLRTRMQPMVDVVKEPVKRSGRKKRKGRRK